MHSSITSNFFDLLCLLFFVLPIFCVYSVSELSAISPSFSSQEIIEPPYSDWQVDPQSSCPFTTNASIQQHAHSPDIAAVSYYSNGKTLNATMLLSHPLKEVSSYVSYHMIIQPSYVYDPNAKASRIYADTIYSENSTEKWSRWVYGRYSNGLLRTVYKKDNYTGFFDEKRTQFRFL
jgi:hypothetical protein